MKTKEGFFLKLDRLMDDVESAIIREYQEKNRTNKE